MTKLVVTLMGGGREEYPGDFKIGLTEDWLTILDETETFRVAVYAAHRTVKAVYEKQQPK